MDGSGVARMRAPSSALSRRLMTRRAEALLAGVSLGAIVALSCGAAQAQSGPFLYVPNTISGNVSVVDTSTNLPVGSAVPVGTGPTTVGVTGDESFAYVTNQNINNVSVINTATNTVVTAIPVGAFPIGVAVSPDGKTAYVANQNSISVINTDTNTVVTAIPMGAFPVGVAVSPDGKTAYVTNNVSSTVSVINTATNTVVTAIGVGINPIGVAVSPDGKTVYVANQFSSSVSVINTATNTVVTAIGVGINPIGVAVSPDGKTAYVTNNVSSTVSVINTATNTVVTAIPVGAVPFGVAVSPDGKTVYVANPGSNSVTPIDTATNTAGAPIPVGTVPAFPGICSNGNALLATGLTFKANTSGALACTLASGPTGAAGPVFTGGTMQFAGVNISSALPISLQAAGGTFDTNGNNATLSGAISGPGSLTKIGVGTLTLSGSGTYTGATFVNAGTLQAGAVNALSPFSAFTVATGATLDLNNFNQSIGSLAGAGNVTLGSATLTTGSDGTSTMFSGTISGPGGLTKVGGGVFTLTGASTYSGPTNVNAGILNVNGSLASTVFVNSGATLMGTGTIGGLNVGSGGTYAPGNSPGTMTVAGNLAFQSGALYLVQVNPSTASSTNVTAGGSASLAGTVQAVFAPGSYVTRRYTILSAAGGVTGTFGDLTTAGLPAGLHATLGYTGNEVILDLTGALNVAGLSRNQFNVATSLNNFFNSGGALPPNFLAIFGLTGGNLANALSQLSGEAATGAQKVGFQLTDQFLNLMLDPFVDGRSGVGGADHPALGFAPDRETLPDDIALAYSKVLKAPPKAVPVYEPRWTVWGGAYGGSNRTTGDLAVTGSHDLSARTVGFAGGFDYRLTPDTVVGLAFAGGGTDWSLAQGLGGGKSDAFQAGIYGATKSGPAYLAAAFAFANHWMSTDRLAFGDHLTADFNAQSYGGRLEGGYRFGMPYGGITPYAAIQAQNFHTPGYTETGLIPSGFALAFGSRDATDTRSELGARFDRVLAVYSNAVLALRGRVAWAHDWVSDPSLVPVFQTLPGASFIVNGATLAKNSALTSAGAELRLANGVALLAKFDGEFASHSSTYSGTGTLRYRW
jgi:YVTN family beta-propeller protein/autotransporter-associated beta strand protein